MQDVSLARALSKLGFCSRTEARELIQAGRVRVDRETVTNPEERVDVRRSHITVDGQTIRAAARVYMAMNKPAGFVTTADDELGRSHVYELLPDGLPRVVAVGRLDLESEGLLLFTNDTRWADRLIDPRSHVEKVYHVRLSAPLTPEQIEEAAAGVAVARSERMSLPRVQPLVGRTGSRGQHWYEVVLHEGKNRQIRQVIEAVGGTIIKLIRVSIGPLQLGKLDPGYTRPLEPEEVQALTDAASAAG